MIKVSLKNSGAKIPENQVFLQHQQSSTQYLDQCINKEMKSQADA